MAKIGKAMEMTRSPVTNHLSVPHGGSGREMRPIHIVVTGGTGFIGRPLCASLSQESLLDVGPASIGNRRTSEIDDSIGIFETVLPGSRLSAIPLDGRDG